MFLFPCSYAGLDKIKSWRSQRPRVKGLTIRHGIKRCISIGFPASTILASCTTCRTKGSIRSSPESAPHVPCHKIQRSDVGI